MAEALSASLKYAGLGSNGEGSGNHWPLSSIDGSAVIVAVCEVIDKWVMVSHGLCRRLGVLWPVFSLNRRTRENFSVVFCILVVFGKIYDWFGSSWS